MVWLDFGESEPLDNISAASIGYTIAIGPQSGRRTLTVHNPALIRAPTNPGHLTTSQNGFSLNAAAACRRRERSKPGYHPFADLSGEA